MADPVDSAYFNEVATRAAAQAVRLEKEVARLVEPIILRYGYKAARNFARLSTEALNADAAQSEVAKTVALVEQRQAELAEALKTTDYDEIRRAKARLKYAQDKLAKMSGSLPPPAWSTPSPDRLLNVDAMTAEIRKKTEPVILALTERVMTEMIGSPPMTAAAEAPVGINWNATNPLVGKALKESAAQITSISETTRGDVMTAIRESYDAGLSIPNTANAIRAKMGETSEARARMIARTEMTRTTSAASLASVEIVDNATGQKHYKVWLTAAGAKHPRHERYAGLNEQKRAMKQPFDVGGFALQYPGDPIGPAHETCNCRCTVNYSEDAPTGEPIDLPNLVPEEAGDSTSVAAKELGLRPGIDTRDLYGRFDSEGNWIPTDPERIEFHRRVMADLLSCGRTKENPFALFTAGGSGVGKSSILDSLGFSDDDVCARGMVKIDPDEIKALMSEYQKLIDAGDEMAASYVHEESSWLAKKIQDEAYDRRFDMLVDGTGDAGPGSYLSKLQRAKAAGYETRVVYVDASWKDALRFAEQRAERTGRRVDLDVMRDIHTKVAQRFPEWADNPAVDQWEMYVNEITGVDDKGHFIVKQEKVASRRKGHTTIRDERRYRQSLAKGDVLDEPPPGAPVSVIDITAPDPADYTIANKTVTGQRKAETYLAQRDIEDIRDATMDERAAAKSEIAKKLTSRLQHNRAFLKMIGLEKVKIAADLEVGDVVWPLHGAKFDRIRILRIEKMSGGEDVVHYEVVQTTSNTLGKKGETGWFSGKMTTQWAVVPPDEVGKGIYSGGLFPAPEGMGQGHVERHVAGLIDNWAGSSADGDSWALALQHAVSDEFGLEQMAFGGFQGRVPAEALRSATDLYARHGAGMRAFVRAMYEQTQQELREAGIKEVVMYRGLRYYDEQHFITNGVKLVPGRLQPASSFSTDYLVAQDFSNTMFGSDGSIAAARVPASRILCSARSGWGCLSEGEFVVLADRPGHRSEMWIINMVTGENRLMSPERVEHFWNLLLQHSRNIPLHGPWATKPSDFAEETVEDWGPVYND